VSDLLRRPLAILLPLQALIGFFHLGLLSPWMDEAGTLMAMRRPLAAVVEFAAQDVHPPLYYVLLHWWLAIPLGLRWEVQARVLSVIFALLATVALDRLWARFLPDRMRWWLLMLWVLSPCVLLYSRMCRSYSLQVLLVLVGAAYLMRLASTRLWENGVVFVAAALGTLYTHYVPGLALLVAANLVLAYRRLWKQLLAINAVIAVGYAPWILRLAGSLAIWGRHGTAYSVTGSPFLEFPLKLGYGAMSFTMGEAVPDPVLLLGGVVFTVAVGLMIAGARQYPRTAVLTTVLTTVGLIGVVRWVAYPFVPARMLFVLPYFLLLMVAGAGMHRRAGNFALGGMLVLSVSGIWCYFHEAGFRNKQYPMPLRQIAGYIEQNSSEADSVILVDSADSDPVGMEYAVGAGRTVVRTTSTDAEQAIRRRVRTIWLLRNTHDLSPGGVNQQVEAELRRSMRPTVFYYQPYSLLERAMMSALGMHDPPWYAQELLEFRR
jgi:hypothetical protein